MIMNSAPNLDTINTVTTNDENSNLHRNDDFAITKFVVRSSPISKKSNHFLIIVFLSVSVLCVALNPPIDARTTANSPLVVDCGIYYCLIQFIIPSFLHEYRFFEKNNYVKNWVSQSAEVLFFQLSILVLLLFVALSIGRVCPWTFLKQLQRKKYRAEQQEECTVELSPFGVQLTELTLIKYFRNNRVIKENETPCKIVHQNIKVNFIPREDIIDIIICESVSSYKVQSMVMFRLHPLQPQLQSSHEKEPLKVRMEPVFSPDRVQMTYGECELMWNDLRLAMGMTSCRNRLSKQY